MKIARFISVNTIIAKVYRDLGIDDVSESDAVEWAAEAIEQMSIKETYDVNTAFLNVKNYQCEMPDGLQHVLQIAKHRTRHCRPKSHRQIFYEVPDECGCSVETEHNDCGCDTVTDHRHLRSCKGFMENWGIVFGLNHNGRDKYEWEEVEPTGNNFFNAGVCHGGECTKRNQYRLSNGKILFSFESGFIVLSYAGTRLDDDGYPMIPDEVSAREAVSKYLIMKIMQREWYRGRDGYQDKMIKAEQDWHWYCKQFKTKAAMPDEDEYRKIARQELRMFPVFYPDHEGHINICGTICDNILIKEECCDNPIIPHYPYKNIKKLNDYLYKIIYDSIPEYKNGFSSEHIAGCSSYVQDGKLYRNLDWFYAETVEFWVKTPYFEGMSYINGFNRGDRITDEVAKKIPYNIVDGINKHGIMMSTHVLYNDLGWTGSGDESIDLTLVPYLVMMNVKSMDSIVDDLSNILSNIKLTPQLIATEYLLQILVTDGTTTCVIMPTPDGYGVKYITHNPKLSNFTWIEREEVSREDQDLRLRPNGIERWNIMPIEMKELRFTLAYESNERLSEFIGINETTRESTDEELNEIYDIAHEKYLNRSRNGELWHTMHSVVYNSNGMESLYIQEDFDNNFINH